MEHTTRGLESKEETKITEKDITDALKNMKNQKAHENTRGTRPHKEFIALISGMKKKMNTRLKNHPNVITF